MKKIVILCLAILFLTTIIQAEEKCEAPILNVGDRWTYKNKDGYTWTREVVGVEDNFYIIRVEGRENLFVIDKATLNDRFFIEPGVGGRRKEIIGTHRKLFDFPMFVGKEWVDITEDIPHSGYKKVTYRCEFKIEGVEKVPVPAGVFTAFIIQYKQTNMKSMRSGWKRFWYSPEVKSWVKQEVEKTKYWPYWHQNAELISYELK